MTLIKCDSDCIYQKDGYCTNDEQALEEKGLNLTLVGDCIYYTKNIENANCLVH